MKQLKLPMRYKLRNVPMAFLTVGIHGFHGRLGAGADAAFCFQNDILNTYNQDNPYENMDHPIIVKIPDDWKQQIGSCSEEFKEAIATAVYDKYEYLWITLRDLNV